MLVVHASDLHLGRPLWALPLHTGLDVEAFRHSALRALGRLVDLCLAKQADFLLLAGDLIEGSVRDYKVGLRLIQELGRLEDTGTRVAWVRGNHDAENRVIRHLLLPSHITELGLSGVQTERFEDRGVALVGKSYERRACCEDLLASYPPKDDALCTIGLLHTSGDGAITGDSYAPCRRRDLVQKGYDYLALGHVHAPTRLSQQAAYSGCLQGRSFLESGPRGCMLVNIEGRNVVALEHHSLDVVRFGVIAVDVSNVPNLDAVVERIATTARQTLLCHAGRSLVARFRLLGEGGVELLLATSPELRQRALYATANGLEGRIAIDGFWIDLGHPAEAPICIAANAGGRRSID